MLVKQDWSVCYVAIPKQVFLISFIRFVVNGDTRRDTCVPLAWLSWKQGVLQKATGDHTFLQWSAQVGHPESQIIILTTRGTSRVCRETQNLSLTASLKLEAPVLFPNIHPPAHH